MQNKEKKIQAFERILTILDELRERCPWDNKQTNETLRPLTIEETYELTDAILKNDTDNIRKELGDVFLHTIFYAKIAEEKSQFDIADVLNSLSNKLIRRHPHVYGDEKNNDPETIKRNWEAIKLKEKDGNKTVLGGIPQSLPALMKAVRIQQKARSVGFDWKNPEGVWAKVKEEISEFEQAVASKNEAEKEAEFGDIMFALINTARLHGINPDNALERTNIKFINRFNYIEQELKNRGKDFNSTTLEEMDFFWEEAKKHQL